MFNKIMNEIESGLTGDSKVDIPYLEKQIKKYKNHELRLEITRACGRLISDMISDEDRLEISKLIEEETQKYNQVLDKARFNVYKGNYGKALDIFNEVISDIEKANMFSSDSESIYFSFNEPFEEILYDVVYEHDKTIRKSPFNYSQIYLEYGSLLFELEMYEQAKHALEKAMRWNPINTDIRFEYGEVFKVQGDIDSFYELSMETLKLAFTKEALARCYRNLGYCFIEKHNYHAAATCFKSSLFFDDDTKQAYAELYYIERKSGIYARDITDEDIDDLEIDYDIQFGANGLILRVMYSLGKQALELENYPMVKYIYSLLYDLTDLDEIGEVLKEIEGKC